ncbi:bifunctional acetaldehyde-CoA/alcohol dehydrogenase [Lentisphaerota bacterium WC36G]|nr:bifunctional acetaldehyde-CoA/alcohol dehydrogenase [Lentisphaerae bacterium WC36]
MVTKKETKKVDEVTVEQQIANLDAIIAKVKSAQQKFASYSQAQVDKIFRAAALAANNARIDLAKQAVEETGMGVIEDKVIKNHFASEYIYNKYKNTKTCGEIEIDKSYGIIKVAEPVGVIAGIIPTTNPTSTAIFKSLLALKTRNGIIFSPHPRAKKCTCDAIKLVLNAAVEAGAPEDILSFIEEPSIALSQHLMANANISLILATGGPGMVKAAYSSGIPSLGVGAGNTPALIDETADIEMAVSSILMSKTFDNGMICASEQSVVAVKDVVKQVKDEFLKRGAYILNDKEKAKVAKVICVDGHLNPNIVGQSAFKIAQMADVKVPEATKVLIGEESEVGKDYPFSVEKLSPVLALYTEENFDAAVDKARKLIESGGLGHTSVMYTDQRNTDRIAKYGDVMKTGRTLINIPASQGAIGDVYNFKLDPSLTLGCGTWGGNSVSQNVGPKHLLNVKTVAARRENMLWFQVPPKVYFKYGCLPVALQDLEGKKKAFIVTDRFLSDNGYLNGLTKALEDLNIKYEIFSDVQPDPTLATAYAGAERMKAFNPDTIIAVGGGSPIDAAKIMWLLYEHPTVQFHDIAMRFMDIKKRIYKFPKLGIKATFVAIPTTSGTGSEVTPFAVITDEKTGAKYPLADYELTPNMAIIDSELAMDMPKSLTAFSGIDALTHALEARVSVVASNYSNAMAMEAIRLIFKYLPRSYKNGAQDQEAREKIHHAAAMAGMAFANAFLGVCHSMAHKLGAEFHIPHGLANALLINDVIKFNATNKPTKQGLFPQYKAPEAIVRYAAIADYLGLGGNTNEEKVEKLIQAISDLKAELDIPNSIKEAGVSEADFMAKVDYLSEQAFDDQCTGANPRYPLITEIKDLYIDAFNGKK